MGVSLFACAGLRCAGLVCGALALVVAFFNDDVAKAFADDGAASCCTKRLLDQGGGYLERAQYRYHFAHNHGLVAVNGSIGVIAWQ